MLLIGYAICGYLLSGTAEMSAQQACSVTKCVTVNVLENDSAILTYTYQDPVTSGSMITIWNHQQNGTAGTLIGTLTYTAETSECTFSGMNECYCNTTHASLKVMTNVNKEDHGKTYFASYLLQTRYFFYTLYVTVPVENVTITNISRSTVAISENQNLTLECKTLPSRPNATIKWEHNSIPLDPLVLEETTIDGLVEVKSVLSLLPDRTLNGNNITCSGNNYLDNFKYDWVTLNVTYPPAGPPVIDNLHEHAHFQVIENKDGFLNCAISDSNPTAQLEWICNDTDFVNISNLNKTSIHLHVRASRKTHPFCSCISMYATRLIMKTDVYLDVLYPATIINVLSNGINISEQQLDVIENETVHVTCATEGNPKPDIVWSLPDKHYIKSTDLTLPNISRNDTSTKYICIATNLMNDSRVSEYTSDTKGFSVNVLYPPRIIDLLNISIIEGNSISVVCGIIPGAPNIPIYISWNNKSGNDSVLLINKINRTDIMWHTCEVNYTIVPSFGGKRSGIDTQRFFFDVLYPPEEININSTTAPNHIVTDAIRMIVNTSIKLFCSAKSNPLPSVYWWTGLNTSSVPEMYVYVSATIKETVTCFAKNVMREIPENKTVDGINSKTIFVDVLYPPELYLTYRNVTEGLDVIISCVHTPGKITHQSIHWTSQNANVTNSNNLIIRNATRKHAGNYTCLVNYTMIPTYGESKSDSIVGVVYLDVFYKAELANFFVGQNNQNQNVTVNEQDSLRMMCILDSNPNSTMQIFVRNSIVASEKLTKTLEHYISQTTCNDAGVYTCYGYNFLNTIHSSRELRIFVNCSPRQSSSADVQQNFTISPDGTATFSFTTLAYPQPSFTWLFRPANSELIEAINGQNNTRMISENEMQINFTVTNVDTSDNGEYVLTINNTFGSYQQSFFLRVLQKESTYDEQNSPQGGGNAGLVAVGVIGGILGIGVIVTVVCLVRRRSHGKQLNAAKNSGDVSLSQVCQYEFKDDDCTVTADSDTAHVYEQLQNSGSDRHYQQLTSIASKKKDGECTETQDGGKSNVYEKLHAAGFDQHYQQLKTVDLMIDKGQHIVYENLRIQHDTGKRNVEDGILKRN